MGHRGAELSTRQAAFMQKRLDLVSAFVPRLEKIDVVLFRTAVDPLTGPYEEDLGWHRATRGHVKVVTVPGEHDELMTSSGAQPLARFMEDFLLARKRAEE